jgi:DNA adenine methylase
MSRRVQPFLKWAGGKSQLIAQYEPYLPPPEAIRCYYEPFLGSAALFFHLQPARAQLSDRNEKLIELYCVVRDQLEQMTPVLSRHQNDRDYFYQIRSLDPDRLTQVERAARLVYLNRTCYNGLYRENDQGEFNVPFGRYQNPRICDVPRLQAASRALQSAELCTADFDDAVALAGAGDFVYFDPPYVPVSRTSNFTSYHRLGFSEADHRRLADSFHTLTARGCSAMLSNSSADLVYELYEGHGYRLIEVQARRSINSKRNGRGPVTELLILNY